CSSGMPETTRRIVEAFDASPQKSIREAARDQGSEMEEATPAVVVRKAYKQYGRGKSAQPVLENLNMTVYRGTIFGLLGASGCGKTTLLSCIVGCQHLDAGDIWVLGGKPGSADSGVPGPRVGYMPQDVALIGEFTVKGAVQYFGWIAGMSDQEIQDQFRFLARLLDMPPEDRFIKNLSFGSISGVTYIGRTTVGLDPVLRASIWEHLVELTVHKHLTVIITTHYIVEAAQIGLLRGGRLLAEQHPNDLMASFNSSLEDVFLTLSQKQENSLQNSRSPQVIVSSHHQHHHYIIIINIIITSSTSSLISSNKSTSSHRHRVSSANRMKALLAKNFWRIFRHLGGICFLVVFPIVELVVFFLAIGGDPQGLKLAIVNQELHNASDCVEYGRYNPIEPVLYPDLTCDFRGLSCNYLNRLNETKVYYKDLEMAKQSVKRGYTTGVLHFYTNYSIELQKRREEGRFASNDTIEHSTLIVQLDMSVEFFATSSCLDEYLREIEQNTFRACNLSSKLGKFPIQYNDPVYGDGNQNYAEFITPGLIVTMLFFLATSITSTIIITERNEGVWDRSLVAGVKSWEILFSHIITQTFCMIVQLIIVLIFTFGVFKVPCLGDFYTTMFLLFLQGFCGMCFGFLVSALCDNITTGTYLALGSFYPTIFLCVIKSSIKLGIDQQGVQKYSHTPKLYYLDEPFWKPSVYNIGGSGSNFKLKGALEHGLLIKSPLTIL
ncbi:hypothetical protein L9F63_024960, partial [Diploptera punctata]